METPALRLIKRADKALNKIILPKNIVEQWGREFIMDIYNDKIVLTPIKK